MKIKAAMFCLIAVAMSLVISPEPAAAAHSSGRVAVFAIRELWRHHYVWGCVLLVLLVISEITKAREKDEPPVE